MLRIRVRQPSLGVSQRVPLQGHESYENVFPASRCLSVTPGHSLSILTVSDGSEILDFEAFVAEKFLDRIASKSREDTEYSDTR